MPPGYRPVVSFKHLALVIGHDPAHFRLRSRFGLIAPFLHYAKLIQTEENIPATFSVPDRECALDVAHLLAVDVPEHRLSARRHGFLQRVAPLPIIKDCL